MNFCIMANRFLETNYYKSPFVRGLKGPLKALYSYIICDCTPSGMWVFDGEAASMYTGFEQTYQEFDENFIKKGKAVLLKNGRYFFPDFIEHQYPSGLQSWNKAHNKIILELQGFGLLLPDTSNKSIPEKYKDGGTIYVVNKGASKGLESPLTGAQGIGIGNGIGNNYINTVETSLVKEMISIFKKSNPVFQVIPNEHYPQCLQLAYRIAKLKGWNNQEVVNGKMKETLKSWEKIVEFVKKDEWLSTRGLIDLNNTKEWDRMVLKMTSAKNTNSDKQQPKIKLS